MVPSIPKYYMILWSYDPKINFCFSVCFHGKELWQLRQLCGTYLSWPSYFFNFFLCLCSFKLLTSIFFIEYFDITILISSIIYSIYFVYNIKNFSTHSVRKKQSTCILQSFSRYQRPTEYSTFR